MQTEGNIDAPEPTPMGRTWLVVLATVLLTSTVFGGFRYWQYEKTRAEHVEVMRASVEFREELSAYLAYLVRNGTSTPEAYFAQ